MKYPPWSLLSGRAYVPSHKTNLAATFARIRRALRATETVKVVHLPARQQKEKS
jgi:hypothetical protein